MRLARALLAGALSLAACSSHREELEWPVTEPGRHPVGYRESRIEYTPELAGSTSRPLRLAWWYPAARAVGDPVSYLGVERPGVFGRAEPAEGDDRPLVVFSHGRTGFAEASGFFGERMAAHGFVVVAPDHTFDTFNELGSNIDTTMFAWRPMDVSAVLDHARALPQGHFLGGRIGERTLGAGYSFGGYTMFASGGARFPIDPSTCGQPGTPGAWCSTMTPALAARFGQGFRDERIEALVILAPGSANVLGPGGVDAITVPTLLVTGDGDVSNADAVGFWPHLKASGSRHVRLSTAGHHTFSHLCAIVPGFGMDDGCGPMAIAPDAAHAIIGVYATAFARRHLDDDETMDAVLSAPLEAAQVAVESR